MTFWKSSLFLTVIAAQACFALAQVETQGGGSSRVDSTEIPAEEPSIEPTANYTLAQILPAYKVALKKGMFEIMGGLGHVDGSETANQGQSNNIKKSPQSDYVPLQFGYGLTDNTNIWISGRTIRRTEKTTGLSLEGTSEPEFSISHSIRNANSSFTLTGTYNADIGPRTVISRAATRKEGNTLEGGASGLVSAGYFARYDFILLGSEVSYLYRDSRIENQETQALFTGQATGQVQVRKEGGHEKTLRGIVELALPIRIGGTIGRTWIEEEEYLTLYQPTTIIYNSYYRNFITGYGRFQINPKFAILPSIGYSEAPDTSGISGGSTQDLSTQVNFRYRF